MTGPETYATAQAAVAADSVSPAKPAGRAASAKPLFRALRAKADSGPELPVDFPEQMAPQPLRDPLDYDPTPPDATRAFLAAEAEKMALHGRAVWEPAVGGGHMAHVLAEAGFQVFASDVVDRGYPGTVLRSFYDFDRAPATVLMTNPPYGEINASNGHGRWLRHAVEVLRVPYVAMLLNADWAAARINGFDDLFERYPPTCEYLCCWKIDFRGGGSPPQRNSWFVWDSAELGIGPGAWVRRRLYRGGDVNQGGLL